jgi:hypothetical protein
VNDAHDLKARFDLANLLKVRKFQQLVARGNFTKAVQHARVELGESFPLGGQVIDLQARRARQ